jgi:hypothetical protein
MAVGRLAGIAGLFVLTAALSVGTGLPAVPSQVLAAAGEKAEAGEPRLSHRRFYTLEPFTIPLLVDGEIGEQFTIVVALELADEDHRGDVAHAVPRIRNEVYNELLSLVTFRRRGAQVPDVIVFKEQLLKVAQRVVGDKVKALLVQQAFKSPLN